MILVFHLDNFSNLDPFGGFRNTKVEIWFDLLLSSRLVVVDKIAAQPIFHWIEFQVIYPIIAVIQDSMRDIRELNEKVLNLGPPIFNDFKI